MKYVQINAHADGWAKTIVFEKHQQLLEQGEDSYVFWARGEHEENEHLVKFASLAESSVDYLMTYLDGKAGFHSAHQTKRLLKRLNEIQPDVVHLHSLLGYYINVKLLFEWLAQQDCMVIWTLHDCWAFTGHCIHFTEVGCNQWRTSCSGESKCPQINSYPPTISSSSVSFNYQAKKELFTLLPANRMKLICPSNWLAGLVKESFLAKYPVEVIHNTVDKSVFHPVARNLRKQIGLDMQFVVLGVSTSWSEKKGLSDFFRLASDLGDSAVILLVGFTKKTRKRIAWKIPSNMILVDKTDSIETLVQYYNTADLLFNPTREDNFPTVNLEAEACGIPVISYNVGGCSETISDQRSRCVDGYLEALPAVQEMMRSHYVSGGR